MISACSDVKAHYTVSEKHVLGTVAHCIERHSLALWLCNSVRNEERQVLPPWSAFITLLHHGEKSTGSINCTSPNAGHTELNVCVTTFTCGK
jgi:hypothetical protein